MIKSITLSILSTIISTIILAHNYSIKNDLNYLTPSDSLTDTLKVSIKPHVTVCKCIRPNYYISNINLIQTLPIKADTVKIVPDLVINEKLTFKTTTNEVTAYPNPTVGETTIEFDVKINGNFVIQISDLNGKLIMEVYNGDLNEGRQNFQVDLNEFENGLYIISIKSKFQYQAIKIQKI
jgi:hypothetical protein